MIYKIQDTTLEGIANAIRAKSGTEEEIQVEDFEYAILNIDTGENTTLAAESAKRAKESADSANTSELAAAEHAGRAAVSEANAKTSENEAKAAAATAAADAVAEVQRLLDDEVEQAKTSANEAKEAAANAAEEVRVLLNDEFVQAETAANNAKKSEANAAGHASAAEESAKSAENFVEAAEEKAQAAAESAKVAQETIWDATGATSEAWARGTMRGVEITSKEEHEAYQDNSKYWCDQAKLVVQDASSSVATANVYAQAEVTA